MRCTGRLELGGICASIDEERRGDVLNDVSTAATIVASPDDALVSAVVVTRQKHRTTRVARRPTNRGKEPLSSIQPIVRVHVGVEARHDGMMDDDGHYWRGPSRLSGASVVGERPLQPGDLPRIDRSVGGVEQEHRRPGNGRATVEPRVAGGALITPPHGGADQRAVVMVSRDETPLAGKRSQPIGNAFIDVRLGISEADVAAKRQEGGPRLFGGLNAPLERGPRIDIVRPRRRNAQMGIGDMGNSHVASMPWSARAGEAFFG